MLVEATLKLRIVPNAPQSEVAGHYGDAIKIKIQAQAVDGKANAALIEFLSETLGLSRAQIHIHSGETSRTKLVRIQGLSQAETLRKLGL